MSHAACCTVRFAAVQEEQKGRVTNELATVLSQISVACKQIASLVCRAGIADMTGVAGLQNISGEDQKKLDVISNEVFSNCLRSSGRTVRPCGSSSSVHPGRGSGLTALCLWGDLPAACSSVTMGSRPATSPKAAHVRPSFGQVSVLTRWASLAQATGPHAVGIQRLVTAPTASSLQVPAWGAVSKCAADSFLQWPVDSSF